MIEFTGVITGEAEKYHRKKERRFGRNLLWLSMILVSPLAVTMCVLMHWWGMLIIYGALFCAVPLLCCIPQSKKEKQNVTPKRIYIIDDYMTAVCGTFEVYKNIKDARQVIDYGAFYDVIFGIYSTKFICQKSLLTQGSLEEFEQLFQGKIKRMYLVNNSLRVSSKTRND